MDKDIRESPWTKDSQKTGEGQGWYALTRVETQEEGEDAVASSHVAERPGKEKTGDGMPQ